MSNKLEMNFQNGTKTVQFSMEGYSEELSKELVCNILKAITESGNESNKISEKRPILGFNKIVEKPKDVDKTALSKEEAPNVETPIEEAPVCESPEELEHDHEPEEDQAAIFGTDTETYQTYYICKCGDKGKHRIKRSQIYVNCWKCGQRMRVRDAHPDGFPMKDTYGNVFIAGEYKRVDHQKYGAMVY